MSGPFAIAERVISKTVVPLWPLTTPRRLFPSDGLTGSYVFTFLTRTPTTLSRSWLRGDRSCSPRSPFRANFWIADYSAKNRYSLTTNMFLDREDRCRWCFVLLGSFLGGNFNPSLGESVQPHGDRARVPALPRLRCSSSHFKYSSNNVWRCARVRGVT